MLHKKLFVVLFVSVLLLVFIKPALFAQSGVSPNKESFEVEQGTVESLIKGLSSDHAGLKSSCAYLLGDLKITQAIIPLMRVLRNDESEEVRISAALALYKIGTPMSINAVKQAIRFDESERVSKLASNFYSVYLRNKFSPDINIDDDSDVVQK